MDLSILIPARNEIYLARTVENILKNIRGKTEIIIGLDGAWADPPVIDDPRVTIFYKSESIGQRAMTNALCRLSTAKYVMKIDAHCAVDEGFDVKMVEAMKGHDDWTAVPALYNLHAFDWKCKKCGNVWYQSPTPRHCQLPGEARKDNPKCDNTTDFEKIMRWKPRKSRRNEAYRADPTLHFQYHREQQRKAQGDFVETMSIQGSCFMLTREKYWELDICSEKFNSWGQQGVEVAFKTWLSGGKVVTVRATWYAHMFRTQGGDFGFPFPLKENEVEYNRKLSREMFFENKWEQQIYPLSWLIEKFKPLPEWHHPKNKEIYDKVMKAGEEFYKRKQIAPPDRSKKASEPKKGIIYYTDNKVNLKLSQRVKTQLKSMGIPITSCSLKPMPDFGKNIHLNKKRGISTMFKQILTALENSDADIVYFCEHDVLYHPSHFDLVPKTDDKFYYNENVWKLDQASGKALFNPTKQVSGIIVNRTLAIHHYRLRIEKVLKEGYSNRMGYEPGTHNRAERVDNLKSESLMSKFPNVDVRHSSNLTPSRWKKEQFRNKKHTKVWVEGTYKDIKGWNELDFIGFLGK